jgi:hypothetical protein
MVDGFSSEWVDGFGRILHRGQEFLATLDHARSAVEMGVVLTFSPRDPSRA